jgi:cytochrome c-type biogenesis protein CcmH/NrfG
VVLFPWREPPRRLSPGSPLPENSLLGLISWSANRIVNTSSWPVWSTRLKSFGRRHIILMIVAVLWHGVIASIHAATPVESSKRAVEQASDLFQAGDVDGAIAMLNKTTELNPSSAEAYHLLGRIYFQGKKKPREAAAAFAQAIKLKPAYPEALNDLAEVYVAQGKSAEAEQALKRAIEIDPKHEDSYVDLAKLYEGRHDIPAGTADTVEP